MTGWDDLQNRPHHFIGNGWVPAAERGCIEVRSPFDHRLVGVAADASTADVDRAVAAARHAFERGPWPRMSAEHRSAIVATMADYLRSKAKDAVDLIVAEMGSPIRFLGAAPETVADLFAYYAQLGRTVTIEEGREGAHGPAHVRREPAGVVAAIAPWNGPLYIMALKVAPALVAGCTVVCKPAPETPLDAFLLADAAVHAGLPDGVLNIVPGGREAGETLVRHAGIDKVSFTGSTVAGRKIGAICGEQLKRCALELGGKSAAVVLEDADPEIVARTTIPLGLGFNSGQACAALTRIIVPRRRQAEFADALVATMEGLKLGDPAEPETSIGPLVAERQRERVERYIEAGNAEGARLVIGGDRPSDLDSGWFVSPTLFTEAANSMKIAQEEIFGPVGVVIPYDGGDDNAMAIANDSSYGLGGAVFSADRDRAHAAMTLMRTGTVGLNTFYIDYKCPFGGFKASGIGREMGPEGLAAFQELKTVFG
jgi:betaine-aldehyde dehydrogenase